MTLDLAFLVRATGASVLHWNGEDVVVDRLHAADLQRRFRSTVIDSRQVTPGDLFVALPGERTDGHAYLNAALVAGATGCIVSADGYRVAIEAAVAGSPVDAVMFVVPEPLTALQQLATAWRRSMAAEVLGITGSIGKTTTKEIVAGLLDHAWPVLRSEANLNTEIGLPLTVLRLEARHHAAVLEMGMYLPGDIALLARIAEPRLGIVTNVAPVHLERAGTIERIARAKSELVAALPSDGLAILNGDDPWTRAMARTSGIARSVLYGQTPDCDLCATNIEPRGLEGVSFTLLAEGQHWDVNTGVAGRHTVGAFLAAAAVARELGLSWDAIVEAMPSVRLDTRQRIISVGSDLVIIDDTYNAAPLSVNAALDLLQSVPGHRVAVLGDMLELGPEEATAHREIGASAAKIADWLVVRGPRAAWIAEGAHYAGLRPERIVVSENNSDAAATVRNIMLTRLPVLSAPGAPTMQRSVTDDASEARWAVLIKGSRGMKMEEIVEILRGTS